MKKTRWIVGLSASLAMLLGISLVAVGCTDPEPEPQPQPQPQPTTYTVTYVKGEGEEGTVPEVKSYEAGASVTLAAANTFTKEGYTFSKWLEDTTEYDAGATYTMPAKNVTFKAKWTKDEEIPPVVDNGDATELKLGDTLIILGEDDVDDMDYLYREVTFTGEANSNYTLKQTLPELDEYEYSAFAIFTPESYENFAPIFEEEVTEYVFKTDANGLATFIIDCGYYSEDDYEAELVTATLNITKGGIYKYTVAFYKDFTMVGQQMGDYATLKVAENTAIGEEDFPAPLTKIGSSFVGWFVAEQVASPSDPDWLIWAPSNVEVTKDTIVTADIYVLPKWEKAPVAGDGKTELALGDNEIVLGSNDVDFMEYLYRELTLQGNEGDTFTLTLTDMSDGAFVFLGEENFDNDIAMEFYAPTVVAIPEGGELTVIVFGGGYSADGNYFTWCNIFVEEGGEFVWEVNFYYDVNSMTRPYSFAEVTDGETLQESDLPEAPTMTGYLFAGWYLVEDGELTETQVDEDYVVTGNVAAAAKWLKLPTITFSNGLGDGAETVEATASDFTVEDGELMLTLPASDTFTKDGYAIVAWQYVDENGDPVEDQCFACGEKTPAGDGSEDLTATFIPVWALAPEDMTAGLYDDGGVIKGLQPLYVYPDKIAAGQIITITGDLHNTSTAAGDLARFSGVKVMLIGDDTATVGTEPTNRVYLYYDNQNLMAGTGFTASLGSATFDGNADWYPSFWKMMNALQAENAEGKFTVVINAVVPHIITVTYTIELKFALDDAEAADHTFEISYNVVSTGNDCFLALAGETATLKNVRILKKLEVATTTKVETATTEYTFAFGEEAAAPNTLTENGWWKGEIGAVGLADGMAVQYKYSRQHNNLDAAFRVNNDGTWGSFYGFTHAKGWETDPLIANVAMSFFVNGAQIEAENSPTKDAIHSTAFEDGFWFGDYTVTVYRNGTHVYVIADFVRAASGDLEALHFTVVYDFTIDATKTVNFDITGYCYDMKDNITMAIGSFVSAEAVENEAEGNEVEGNE